MDKNTDKIIKCLGEINQLKKDIYTEAEKDPARLWYNAQSISNITQLINKIFELSNSQRKKNPLNNNLYLKHLLSTNTNKQKEIMYSYTIPIWLDKFKEYINIVIETIFKEYIYYNTYDTFSDNSRDNNLKAEVLASIAPKNARIMEIGPGPGPLFRRMLKKSFDIYAIEFDKKMIKECIRLCPEGKGRVIHSNFFRYNLREKTYAVLFIESGIFLFTTLNKELVFETFSPYEIKEIEFGLKKIFRTLKDDGVFLLGIQGLMKKVKISKNLFFKMKRIQEKHHAIRKIKYYRKRVLKEKEILYEFENEKFTMNFEEFAALAGKVGFSSVTVDDKRQWVILRKI